MIRGRKHRYKSCLMIRHYFKRYYFCSFAGSGSRSGSAIDLPSWSTIATKDWSNPYYFCGGVGFPRRKAIG